MNRTITVYNDDKMPVVTIKVGFESGSVTVQNGKGNSLVTLTSDNTIVEHAGYHVHIGVDFGTCPERSE